VARSDQTVAALCRTET